jgi:hypothetical protein
VPVAGATLLGAAGVAARLRRTTETVLAMTGPAPAQPR